MHDGPLARLGAQAGASAENWALRHMADPTLPVRMRRFLRASRYDVIQTYGLRADLATRWLARSLGIPVVSAIVSVDPWRRGWHVMADQLTMDGVAAWIATSQAARETCLHRERPPADRIHVIPTGIEDRPVTSEKQRRVARNNFGIDENDGPVIAVLANLRAAKGHGDLIAALAQLKDRWPSMVCICAGRDDSRGAIPAQAERAGLGGQIRFPGFVSDAASVYDAADMAVLPSHWEGMPHALIEALRAGLPSIATDVGGNGEVVRHGREGLLCTPRNPRDLAAALERAFENPTGRKVWGGNARARYESLFRVETMVDRMTEVYESVAR